MPKRSLVARGAKLARVPNAMQFVGQPANYINRALVQLKNKRFAYPATEAPYEFDPDAEPAVDARCKVFVERGVLWPKDEATAKAYGVPFVATVFDDGEWIKKTKGRGSPPTAPNSNRNDNAGNGSK